MTLYVVLFKKLKVLNFCFRYASTKSTVILAVRITKEKVYRPRVRSTLHNGRIAYVTHFMLAQSNNCVQAEITIMF